MYLKEAKYTNFENLYLHIYTVGYPVQGESILMVIAEGKKPLLVLVTDSFAQSVQKPSIKDKNSKRCSGDKEILWVHLVENILKDQWESAPINIFIWTHPHKDHSVAIPYLLTTCDPKGRASILAPFLDKVDKAHLCGQAKLALKFIIDKYRKSFIPCMILRTWNQIPAQQCLLRSIGFGVDVTIKLYILAPEGTVEWNQAIKERPDDPNDFSLAYLVEVNGLRIFMGGDLSVRNLAFIPSEFFSNLCFVKIPHHASSGLKSFQGKLLECNARRFTATSTQYRSGKSNLPEVMMLDEYKRMGADVYTTCRIPYSKKDDKNGGIIHTSIQIATGLTETTTHQAAMQF